VNRDETRRTVIAVLTATADAPDGKIPADVQVVVNDLLGFQPDVRVTVPAGPLTRDQVIGLLREAAEKTALASATHGGTLLGVMAALFRQLAIEAAPHVDVREFLSRMALHGADETDRGA
jgi:hypothetical protein